MPYEGLTMAQARSLYFRENNFAPDGGYSDSWLTVRFVSLPLTIPNIPSRVAAIRYHDLHHLITGYATDIYSEFEISAWELGAGCKDFAFAWVINLAGLSGGLLTGPDKALAAFLRGRRSNSLYGQNFDELLQKRVEDVRAQYVFGQNDTGMTPADLTAFALCSLAAVPVGIGVLLGGLSLTQLAAAAAATDLILPAGIQK